MPIEKIPIFLVTGFLGSGKTTFLRRLANSHPDWQLVFLVNEFAQTSVDGDTLAAAGTPTQSVVGGSLFCNCKAHEFARVMNETVLALHRESPLDAVVIETSGIADPEAIGKMMRDFDLDTHFVIQRVLCIVSPNSVLKLIDHLPNIAAQIRTSDLIVINKTDLSEPEKIQAVKKKIRSLNEDAHIVHSQHCEFDFELTARERILPKHDLSTLASNPFTTHTLHFDHPIPHTHLQSWLGNLPKKILRVKGNLLTDRGWVRLEKSFDSCEWVPMSEDTTTSATSALVLIVHDDDEAVLHTACEALSDHKSISAS